MGLFDTIEASSDLDANISCNRDALVLLLHSVAQLDGCIDGNEIKTLIGILGMNPTLEGEAEPDFQYLISIIQREGLKECIHMAFNYLPDHLHLSAFGYACMVAMADGNVSHHEKSILTDIAESYDTIDIAKAKELIRSAKILMRPFK